MSILYPTIYFYRWCRRQDILIPYRFHPKNVCTLYEICVNKSSLQDTISVVHILHAREACKRGIPLFLSVNIYYCISVNCYCRVQFLICRNEHYIEIEICIVIYFIQNCAALTKGKQRIILGNFIITMRNLLYVKYNSNYQNTGNMASHWPFCAVEYFLEFPSFFFSRNHKVINW